MTKWIVAIIAIEAITEILLHGTPFVWLRKLAAKNKYSNELLSCGWCLSFWVSLFVCSLVYFGLWILLIPIALHRLSNLLHYIWGIAQSLRWRK